jgi:probable HAF family extracellular repeat protein
VLSNPVIHLDTNTFKFRLSLTVVPNQFPFKSGHDSPGHFRAADLPQTEATMKSKILTAFTTIALLAVLALTVRLFAQDQQNKKPVHYTVTDFGTLGGTFSTAGAINNRGSVVGFATLTGDTSVHAFLWRKGLMTDLGTLGGSDTLPFSAAVDINDSDEIVGFSETSTPDPLGENFCGDSLVCLPFVWRAGVMSPLPTLGGNNGQASGINNRGEVVGFAENSTPDPTCVPPQVLRVEPVIWDKGEVQELPTFPGDPDGVANAINDAGQVLLPTGDCTHVGPPNGHDSLLRHGTLTDFGSLGGSPVTANDINNKGQVVGTLVDSNGNDLEAILWQNGMATGLGTLPGDVTSVANAMNEKGQATGQSCDTNGSCRGFVWEDGVMTDLDTLVPADSTLVFPDPIDINSRGQIVGLAVVKSTGELRAFLLTPSHGEAVDESAASAAPGNISERPKVVLPERVRRMLRQRVGFRGQTHVLQSLSR